MKNIKKMLSVLLAMVMIMSMAGIVSADENGKYSITINNSKAGHTYEAYQIFTGDVYISAAEEGKPVKKVLSNIVWGSSVTKAGQSIFGNAATKAEGLTDANADAFAKEISPYLVNPVKTTSTQTGSTYVLENLDPGYYLVKDQNGSLQGDNDSYTKYILKVVADTEVSPKSSIPTVQKKVDDINDSINKINGDVGEDAVQWNDSADYDMKDLVPFQLKATLADNVTDYMKYKIVFHDTMSAGLTFNAITRVIVDGNPVTEGYSVDTVVNADDTTSLTITFENIKAQGATDESEVIVEYTAVLNEKAVIGAEGNPNYVYLEYSNNPNWICGWVDDDGKPDTPAVPSNPSNDGIDNDGDGKVDEDEGNDGKDNDGDGKVDEDEGHDGEDNDGDGEVDEDDETDTERDDEKEPTGKTEVDKVIVFTYKVVVNKVDENEAPLAGAEFTLFKSVRTKNENGNYVLDDEGKYVTEYVAIGKAKVGSVPNTEGATVANQFSWVGLDDGNYKISETKTPDGYNTIEDIEFTITAEHNIKWEDQAQNQVLLELSGGNLFTGEVDANVIRATGTLTAKVINEAGALLPETGGIGTTIFYIVGGLLVFAAVVVLITKKRIKD